MVPSSQGILCMRFTLAGSHGHSSFTKHSCALEERCQGPVDITLASEGNMQLRRHISIMLGSAIALAE